MHAYTNLNKMCSYSQFQVEFVGEDGVDTGGLKREFFSLLFKKFNRKYMHVEGCLKHNAIALQVCQKSCRLS